MKQFIVIFVFFLANYVHADIAADLAAPFQYRDVKISPDGKKIALLTLSEGRQALVVLSTTNYKLIGGTNFKEPNEVGDFFWASDDRILINIAQKRGWEEKPSNYGEIYGVDFDGKNGELLFGFRVASSAPSLFKGKEASQAWGTPLHRLPDNEKEVLITSTPMSKGGDRLTEIKRLNIYDGVLSNTLMQAPISYADFLVDSEGNILTATGTNDDAEIESYWRNPQNDQWQPIPESLIGGQFRPLKYDAENNLLYATSNAMSDTTSLITFAPNSENYTVIFNDPQADISEIIFSNDGDDLLAIKTDLDKPILHFLNDQHPEALVLKAMQQAFSGKRVSITSSTQDGRQWVVLVTSDVDTPTFFLFDKPKGKLIQLFKNLNNISPSSLANTTSFSLETKDNLTLHGYFTPPKTKRNEKPAAVVLVHGGPRARDFWGFDRLTQLLALNGYGVVQVNFRGSEGFGKSFTQAGNEHWGDHIQQDILSALHFALKEYNLDPARICIMGASFGAYSSIQSSILYPEHYRCALANAGVYDLKYLKQEGDVPQLGFGEAFLNEALGTSEYSLLNFSPVNTADGMQIPVFIAHGKQDKRAPYEHAERLLKTLAKSKATVETFIEEKEGHGFYNPTVREKYYRAVLGFLNKYNPVN